MPRRLPLVLACSVLVAPLLGGCGNSADSVPAHTAEEQKLVNQISNETPEQQIERIQKGPMPESAKTAMIQKIKSEHGIK